MVKFKKIETDLKVDKCNKKNIHMKSGSLKRNIMNFKNRVLKKTSFGVSSMNFLYIYENIL